MGGVNWPDRWRYGVWKDLTGGERCKLTWQLAEGCPSCVRSKPIHATPGAVSPAIRCCVLLVTNIKILLHPPYVLLVTNITLLLHPPMLVTYTKLLLHPLVCFSWWQTPHYCSIHHVSCMWQTPCYCYTYHVSSWWQTPSCCYTEQCNLLVTNTKLLLHWTVQPVGDKHQVAVTLNSATCWWQIPSLIDWWSLI